jgi:hypothetical protein
MIKLKPCPFCDGSVDVKGVYSVDSPINGNGQHSIVCCATMTCNYLLDDYCHKGSVNSKHKTKLKLISQWNNRG